MTRRKVRVELVQEHPSDLRDVIASSLAIWPLDVFLAILLEKRGLANSHILAIFHGKKTPRSNILAIFPSWALAARITFGLSPNSAACERVFSLVATMFGDQQMSALGDLLRAALLLKYNKRSVG